MLKLSERQEKIVFIVKKFQPITSVEIAEKLNVNRSTLRNDLSVLTMFGILNARPKVGYYIRETSINNEFYNYVQNVLVNEIKSVPVVTDEKSSINDVIVLMFLEDVGTVYITSENVLVGVVSRKDLLRSAIGTLDIHKTPVGVVMTRMPKVIYCYEEDNILSAAEKLIKYGIDSVPVVRETPSGFVVSGRISKTTITKYFVEVCTV